MKKYELNLEWVNKKDNGHKLDSAYQFL